MIKVDYYPAHKNAKNYNWFMQVYSMLDIGGKLQTNVGAYVKTATGFSQA